MMAIKSCNAECRDGMYATETAFINQGNQNQRVHRVSATPCSKSAPQQDEMMTVPPMVASASVGARAI